MIHYLFKHLRKALANFENSLSLQGLVIEKELCKQYLTAYFSNIKLLENSKPNVEVYKDKLREAFLLVIFFIFIIMRVLSIFDAKMKFYDKNTSYSELGSN
jgi:hypothetical protein